MKKKIAVLAGGYSGEIDVSRKSAAFVMEYMDRERYEPYLIELTEQGWDLILGDEKFPVDLNDLTCQVGRDQLSFDLFFIVIHGTPGEDGKVQGLLDMKEKPYTTGGVLNTSLTFNKFKTNELLKCWGLNTVDGIHLRASDPLDVDGILGKIGLPCFVKPNHGGSSLGNSKVEEREELAAAVDKAFAIDDEILVQPLIEGRELACGVIPIEGTPTAMPPIEIISHSDFFDYHAKYHSKATEEITPAQIPDGPYQQCQQLSEFIYRELNCKGMIRVDYFLVGEELYVIEVNTVPGLSDASLLPQEVEAYGLGFREMVSWVIEGSSG